MTPQLMDAFATSASTIGIMMLGMWLLSVVLHDVSIVDMVWGVGFVLLAWANFLQTEASSVPQLAVVAATSIWGLRLSLYLTWRNLGRPEDFRYQAMRQRRPWFPVSSLLIVFGLQGLVMWVVSLPIQAALAQRQGQYSLLLLLTGSAAWTTGLLFETVGDWQLARFKADPQNAGKVMDRGLWRYTRHPNYFGDFMVWWGLFFMALSLGRELFWTAAGPLIMSFFLMKISGVALLEKDLVKSRSGYEDYVSRTSAFFPMKPQDNRET